MKFDILCPQCRGKMDIGWYDDEKKYMYLQCETCNTCIDGDFIKIYCSEKYADKIKAVEITGNCSANILFKSGDCDISLGKDRHIF